MNKLGGVDVNVRKPLNYDDNWGNLHVHLQPGMQHLNGYKAMGYVRIRHSDSDIARSERQHEFLEAIRSKVGPGIIVKLPDIFKAITSDLHTNMTQDQMIALANFARKLKPEQIQLVTLPNYEGRSYVYIYQDKAAKVIADLFYEGDVTRVQLDLPNREQVASLNNSGGLNSAGEGGGGEGRRRRTRRRGSAAAEASLPRDDNGNPLLDSKDGSDTATDLTPVDGSAEEKASDGARSHRKRADDTGDTSGDAPKIKDIKDKDTSGDAGSKDSGKDTGSRGDSKDKDTGSKTDSGGDKSGDKSGGAGDKTGGDKGDTTGNGAGGTL